MIVTQDKSLSAPAEGDRPTAGELQHIDENPLLNNEQRMRDNTIIKLSRDAYESSKTWFDSSIRAQQERNLRAFNNEHPPGSKYHTEQYRKKSKLFRPKTRTVIRKQAAAAAVAFFSTSDVLHCSAVNDADEEQRLAAEIHMGLAQFRLERPETYWFQTVIGGLIDATVTGVVCSKQDWKFTQKTTRFEETYITEDGGEISQLVEEETILEDRPRITLLPLENLRFDPACDWRDPVNTSPYIIEMMPMYIQDVLALMQRMNPVTGQPHYRTLSRGLVAAAIHQDWDSIRKAREGDRLDKYDNDTEVRAHQSVWVHKHTMQIEGQDYCWDTLGTEIVLSEIAPIEEVYLTGKRPYVIGNCNIEPHKIFPAGTPELVDGLQEEVNDIANLRLDNVKLALNKRYFAKRGAGIDVRSLIRNVAGSVTFMNNPTSDVSTQETKDVTGSSYQEQDRLNLDFDDMAGDFNSSSVASNRSLNQTVGGMEMLGGEANQVKEMIIRTFAETWMQPVLRQLIELEAVYETDEAILLTAGNKAKLSSVDEILKVIAHPIRVKVNVGIDATNPQKRVERLAYGLDTIAKFVPQLAQDADGSEIVKEVMGALGYADGVRFYPSLGQDQIDPQLAQAQQIIQELRQYIETEQIKQQGMIKVAQMREEGATGREKMKLEVQLMMAQAKGNQESFIIQMKNRLEEIDRMIQVELSRIKRQELFLQREALSQEILEANRNYQLELRGQEAPPESGAFNLPGEDKAGVISRDKFGLVPSMAETMQ